jgi:hypothetical protein
MSLAKQFRQLNRSAAAFRQEVFGDNKGEPCQIDYNRGEKTVTGYYAIQKAQGKTEEAGWLRLHQAVVRILKTVAAAAGFVPELNKEVVITDDFGVKIKLRIDEIRGQHPASVEWALGCNGDI